MNQLLRKLRKLDEVLLLELLEISSEDIVDAFFDKIKENEYELYRKLEKDFETEE